MKPLLFLVLVLLAVLALPACRSTPEVDPQLAQRAREFLSAYQERYLALYAASSEAQWASNTRIVEGDPTNAQRVQQADEALAAFTGSVENIETARGFLDRRGALPDGLVRQLERVLFLAGGNPQTVPTIVRDRITAETAQTETLYGYAFQLDGHEITPNQIDEALRDETDLKRRQAVWEASKEVGRPLKSGLEDLRRLRNASVQALGYHDYFAYQASEYGMTTAELMAEMEKVLRELRPLFRELHTWTRYELARRHAQPVPELIPAHWLPNRWGQDWSALVDVPGFDLDPALAQKGPEWLVQQAERFYVSLGFEPLPAVFWQKSSLYPLPADATFKKNTHASAWHMDLQRDVRSLMSVEPNSEWYETTHHELGHIYYYLCYTNPAVPPLLREGANRAYHEAVGSLMGLAAMQPRFVAGIGLEGTNDQPDPIRVLLKEALNYVVFIPWSAGTMSSFEKELYADELPSGRWNKRWWELVARYQGIAPPTPRGEDYCDAATKTHINDDAAQYYDYALSFLLLFQLHDHIAREILHQDPHDTNYYGNKQVGDFLRRILAPGSSVDWRELLVQSTGSELSARPMLRYFEPLVDWLKRENAGRKATLPAL